MSKLITDFGLDRFNSAFQGAWFIGPDNKVHEVRRADILHDFDLDKDTYRVKTYSTETGPDRIVPVENVVDGDFFKDFNAFSYPPLGWRSAINGRLLVHCSFSVGSYQRGLKHSNVEATLHPVSYWARDIGLLDGDPSELLTSMRMGHMVMMPQYTTMDKGVRRMNEGKIMSFAINERIAVCIGADASAYDLLYDTACVGKVSHDGTITSSIDVSIIKEAMK